MRMLSRSAAVGLGVVIGLALHVAPAAAGPLPFHGYTYFGSNGSVYNIPFFDPDGIDGFGGYFGFNQFEGSNPFDQGKSDDHGLGNLPLPGGGNGIYNGQGGVNSGGAGGNAGGGDFGSPQSFAIVTQVDPVETEAVPGPGALLLLGLGVSGIAVAVGRKRRR